MELGQYKKIRDRAYTHLKDAMAEIRHAGQYVFRLNKERYQGYISDRLRQKKIRLARNSKKKQKQPQ